MLDVQGADEKKRRSSYYNVSENKRLKILKSWALGGGRVAVNYSRICTFRRGLEPSPPG